MDNKKLFNIFVIVFIDLLGFGLILPLLPFYADEYNATPFVVGMLTASYAAAQLIGAPILGRLSDRYGRRPILVTSIFGTFLSLLLLGAADPLGNQLAGATGLSANILILALLFASRILDGLTGGNISVAQAYITDITDESNRSRGLGLIGAAFGLGFILGPAMGGFLSSWGFAAPAFAAAGLAGLNLLSVIFTLPESLDEEQRRNNQENPQARLSIRALINALRRERVGPLLHVRFFYGLAFATFQTIFPLFAQYQLDLDARQTGYILTYVGVLAALVQGVAIGVISKRTTDSRLILISTAILTASLLAWSFTPNVAILLVILVPIAFAGGILNTILNSALTKAVYPEEVGGTLGIATSLESLTRVISPGLGGFLLGSIGNWAPGVAASVIMVWVVSFVYRRIIVNPDPPLPGKPQPAQSLGSN